jgi:steroid delta-isomerase-like uncharacterized protein
LVRQAAGERQLASSWRSDRKVRASQLEVDEMAADAIALAKEGVDAFNKADWAKTRSMTTADVVYNELATGRRVVGADDFVELSKGWRTAFPDAKGTVTVALESGDTAVLEITWTGTQTGELLTPTGDKIPPTGKKVSIPAVQIVRTSGGKIAETKHYFDLMTMMAQLGVIPAATRA